MAREPILIVDDNPQNLKLAKVILASEGYEVRTAIDAEEALRILESFTPRLILMDLQLPRMDGLELTRQLKADPARRGIIIMVLTAYAMKGDEEKAFAAGCDGYMSKPIDTDALRRVVAEHLARRVGQGAGR
jgi:CheY-like chemotaxis protein